MPAFTKSPWIAVTDRLPPDSQPVLAAFARTGMNPRVADYDEIFGWAISGEHPPHGSVSLDADSAAAEGCRLMLADIET